jgi:hypothetical protein
MDGERTVMSERAPSRRKRGWLRGLREALLGVEIELPGDLLRRYPELGEARWRRGGLPPRVGGWCLGQPTVSAITLWRTIYLAPGAPPDSELLLHELRHVQQFDSDASFPIRYIGESLRHGYHRNRFEADARAYARDRARGGDPGSQRGDH